MHKGLITLLSFVPTVIHAQTGSPVIISAFPNATAAADDNHKAPGTPAGKVFKYFMQIWLENQVRSILQTSDSFSTPTGLRDVRCPPPIPIRAANGILLTNYNGITHPSEPNYVAASAGTNFGITNDDYYDIPADEKTIFDLLEAKGLKWKSYNEEIPAPGWTGYSAYGGAYVRKHNPAIIFDNIGLNQTRSANVVSGDHLKNDIVKNNMPAYSFYTPNITNDGHNTNASFAGTWLFMKDALVLITFDENASGKKRNQVWSCLIGGVIPKHLKGTTDNTFYTHYSTLHTVELNWGLGSLGRGDANKTLANVFGFAADVLGYKNVEVTDVPPMNATITGLLTGKSWNETHPA
ncbi:phosphoesterase family-domain-containing protein [Amanita rubescens]|nr:phosphoesterase family-domain-containing protein [Amanita rubescens]